MDSDTAEDMAYELRDKGFFDAPASTKYHGNYPGGLFQHSYMVTLALLDLTDNLHLTWERPESPYLVGMLHDLCKTDQYVQKEDGTYEYAKNLPLTGHGDKSVILAQKLTFLTDEEVLCIRWHMGAYDEKENWNALGAAIEKYPNVLYTHTADMIASRIHGV
jgi:23S rRNA maturation-related 3'-5' exoribonuclease YhaM